MPTADFSTQHPAEDIVMALGTFRARRGLRILSPLCHPELVPTQRGQEGLLTQSQDREIASLQTILLTRGDTGPALKRRKAAKKFLLEQFLAQGALPPCSLRSWHTPKPPEECGAGPPAPCASFFQLKEETPFKCHRFVKAS